MKCLVQPLSVPFTLFLIFDLYFVLHLLLKNSNVAKFLMLLYGITS